MKPATQKKLTKRQRKALNGPNAAVERSFAQGSTIERVGATYKGRNPVYRIDPLTGMAVKTLPGIPFARAGVKS